MRLHMKYVQISSYVLFAVLLFSGINLANDNFYAYYTKLDVDDAELGVYGKYADIVIQYPDSIQILFSRESSYLPCLKTVDDKYCFPELVERRGDGTRLRPDSYNRFSYARIVENTPEKIVVHWRYVPEFNRVELKSYVEEYFTFYPDGKVDRTFRRGNTKIDDWEDPANITKQYLHVTPSGIEILSTTMAKKGMGSLPAVTGTDVIIDTLLKPSLWFRFDEGLKTRNGRSKDLTQEASTGSSYRVHGHKTLWKKGVSGTALNFDGYTSSVFMPASEIPDSLIFSDGFSVEAWIAIGTNAWNWAPIVHQSEFGIKGFYLGIDYAGRAGFMADVGGIWEEAVTRDPLERFRWTHIAGTYNMDEGLLCIYIDGKLVRCTRTKREIDPDVDHETIQSADDREFYIGLNDEKIQAANAHRQWTYPSITGFDGLIDEVRIYDETLSWQQIKDSYDLYKPADNIINNPDMDKRNFPANPQNKPADTFGAFYTKLNYYETWDNMWRVGDHADIVVAFEHMPARFAFWRGLSYGIGMITENGKWSGDQSRETWGDDIARGCCEHMSDKQCRHSHVRLIENTPARSVVHWRYAEVDVKYIFPQSNGPFADEYWTFYPDGVGIRHVASGKGGWQETMFYSEPGTRPEDNVELNAFTVIDEQDTTYQFDWSYHYPFPGDEKPASITMVNMKSRYRPFYIYTTGSAVETFVPPLVRRDYSAFHWANHYPVSQMPSDGRSAEADDRAAHSSLVWGEPTEDYLMVGFTNKKPNELKSLARSWNYPAELDVDDGCESLGYVPEERAYHLLKLDTLISFTLEGSEETPVHNPAFVISNWTGRDSRAIVKLNEVELKNAADIKQGVVYDTKGRLNLIIWLRHESASDVKIEIGE